ncbi:MAG: SDR family NAD(P)-dependent oxidoreductase [Hyphomicrobiales bacterium]|nr:SDR family NAD(P)-dependent oxidoreductase [Hyphomicrobiales bacterium]
MTAALLHGRRALVTGAARGLGAAIGRAFCDAGAEVAALDHPSALAAPGAWQGALALACDVTDPAGVEQAITEAADSLGGLDIVVANAGLVPPWRQTEELDFAEWDAVMAVNVRGVAATVAHAVPHLKTRGGAIILMASINAMVSHPRQMLYTASKHAVLGIMRAAALDLGRYGIRVNALAPGPVATEALIGRLHQRASEGGPPPDEALSAFAAQTPLGRMASEDDVARAALFLASELASGLTGRVLPVDAGLIP